VSMASMSVSKTEGPGSSPGAPATMRNRGQEGGVSVT